MEALTIWIGLGAAGAVIMQLQDWGHFDYRETIATIISGPIGFLGGVCFWLADGHEIRRVRKRERASDGPRSDRGSLYACVVGAM